MAKTVNFGARPKKGRENAQNPDDWVNSPAAQVELKRFTIDIPKSLHTRIKTQCASRGVKMREEILGLLENHFSVNT